MSSRHAHQARAYINEVRASARGIELKGKKTIMKFMVVILASGLSMIRQIAAQEKHSQDGNSHSTKISTLELCIPIVVVVLVFLIITAVIVYTVYRQKKYGAFCCLMPKMRYRVGSEEVGSFHRDDYPSPPPSYDVSHRYGTLAPPDYHDAFQDVLLDSGENNNNTETTDSRYTTWTNILISTVSPPEYSVATCRPICASSTELGTEVSQRDSSNSSGSAVSYTTTSSAPLQSASPDEQITIGAVLISDTQETMRCDNKQKRLTPS